jgi:hypothetical protein
MLHFGDFFDEIRRFFTKRLVTLMVTQGPNFWSDQSNVMEIAIFLHFSFEFCFSSPQFICGWSGACLNGLTIPSDLRRSIQKEKSAL